MSQVVGGAQWSLPHTHCRLCASGQRVCLQVYLGFILGSLHTSLDPEPTVGSFYLQPTYGGKQLQVRASLPNRAALPFSSALAPVQRTPI